MTHTNITKDIEELVDEIPDCFEGTFSYHAGKIRTLLTKTLISLQKTTREEEREKWLKEISIITTALREEGYPDTANTIEKRITSLNNKDT